MVSYTFGPTTLAKLGEPGELKELLVDPWLRSETIVVKPNWVSSVPGGATDVRALRSLLEALDSRVVVTESHMIMRSPKLARVEEWDPELLKEGISIEVDGKLLNWIWLYRGDGWNRHLRDADWDWFKDRYWDAIRSEDKAFLDSHGFTDLFKEFGVEYVNITDELWSGRTADPAELKHIVESRYGALFTEKLYSIVPKKLFDLRGSTFISLARVEVYNSFTMKNLFGMLPDPIRAWWHGPNRSRLAKSIIDINKLYRSLFNVYGICEALHTGTVLRPEGEYPSLWGKYDIVERMGFVAFGRDPVSLDAILCNLAGFDMNEFGGYLGEAEKVFGPYDRSLLAESKMKAGNWLKP